MKLIRDRLHKAIAEQRHSSSARPPAIENTQTEAAFLAVADAAEELCEELSDLPGLSIVVGPQQVRIEFYDNCLWFSYSTEKHKFVGNEVTSRWMEGGLREEHFEWDTAEACVESMIQACARYALMAEAMTKLQSS